MDLINVNDLDYSVFSILKTAAPPRGNPHGRRKEKYLRSVCAFDIETSNLPDMEQSIMYIWQFQLDELLTIYGRTWDEFIIFLQKVKQQIGNNVMVIYVHNLSFEFQFLKGIYAFESSEVFATAPRTILKCTMFDSFEFRCSYLHSNMSLAAFTKKMGVPDPKLSGFDYSKVRYPWTDLTEFELRYCVNDVKGLVQAIKREMSLDQDTLYTIPLTSTGYVRRDCKRAMKNFNHKQLSAMLPDPNVYRLLREAFRGGNTHANRWYAGDIIPNVYSKDLSSAYPSAMVNFEFPMKKFIPLGSVDTVDFIDLLEHKHKALLFRCCFHGITLISRYTGAPYLARDKCRNIQNGRYDNGRILQADYIETTITDIDFKIIRSMYDWEGFKAFDVYYSQYGPLPDPLRDTVKQYYRLKTELKQDPGAVDPDREYYYFKAKNKLNSLYGMCAQDPVKDSIDFINGEFVQRDEPLEDLLKRSYRRAFLSYAWGVWVTCWCRWLLQQGIDTAGDRFIYCDTDSVKTIGTLDMSAFNDRIRALSLEHGGYAEDSKGKIHYMGVFEDETGPDGYSLFSTLGAKKYCYIEDDKLHITIAGVNKKKGAEELGDIRNFKEGFIFRKAGGTESVYNDNVHYDYFVDGNWLTITDNVVIRDSTYELGLTEEYRRILKGVSEIKYADHDIPGLYKMKR